MKKVLFKSIIVAILIAISVCALTACNAESVSAYSYFGQFGCYGNYLIERAVKTISAFEAKQLIGTYSMAQAQAESIQPASLNYMSAKRTMAVFTSSDNNATGEQNPTPEAVVDSLITRYSGFVVTTKYYDAKDELGLEGTLCEKRDEYIGGVFKSVLEENNLETFAQLVARNIIAYDGLVEWMEARNAEFAASPTAKIAPFLNIYTYHTDKEGKLIIQVHSFRELNAKELGGISSNFRQDTEIVYDKEGKMILWQTSLGISNASPTGTMRQGYILSLDLEWIEKE